MGTDKPKKPNKTTLTYEEDPRFTVTRPYEYLVLENVLSGDKDDRIEGSRLYSRKPAPKGFKWLRVRFWHGGRKYIDVQAIPKAVAENPDKLAELSERMYKSLRHKKGFI